MEVPVKRLRAEKIKSPNGEVHFFVEESSFPERSENINKISTILTKVKSRRVQNEKLPDCFS